MYDVAIIGGGPGGYAAALYAHNFGLSVALVEKDTVGGTCLNRGCVPAKAWLQTAGVYTTVGHAADFGVVTDAPTLDWKAALDRKNGIVDRVVKGLTGLLKSRKVEIIDGFGKIAGPNSVAIETDEGTKTIEAKTIILATGSVPRSIPNYEVDGVRIVTSDHALDWETRPERVAIIGGGVIGCEFASLLSDTGAEVHLFEALDQLLPGADPAAVKVLDRAFRKNKVKVTTGVPVEAPQVTDTGVVVTAGNTTAEVDVVLVAVGRAPLTDNIGLENTSVQVERGFIHADLTTMQTAQEGVYAIGDIVAGTPQLAHAGFAEAIAAVTHIATGETAPVDYRAIPLVVYTHPEVAWVGLTEQAAKDAGYEVEVAEHGMRGLARAVIQNDEGGMVKVVSQKDGPVLGASVVGPAAGEMIHELMYVVAWEALPAEAAALVHAHPTIAEAIGETLLASAGRPLH